MKYGISCSLITTATTKHRHPLQWWVKSLGDWLLFDTIDEAKAFLSKIPDSSDTTFQILPFTVPLDTVEVVPNAE